MSPCRIGKTVAPMAVLFALVLTGCHHYHGYGHGRYFGGYHGYHHGYHGGYPHYGRGYRHGHHY